MTDHSEVSPRPRPGKWLRRRSVPLPTWRLWLAAFLVIAGIAWLVAEKAHGWLCPTEPVEGAGFVAVEGWAPDYVMEETRRFAEDTSAVRIFTTGGPVERGMYLSDMGSYARIAANTLAELGAEPQTICPVPATEVMMERTRASALALREVLAAEPVPPGGRKLNLITLGTHARRSWRIYQDVLGPGWSVGIISIRATGYDPERWWAGSLGIKYVLEEYIALAAQRN